jgi:hypothetical protein
MFKKIFTSNLLLLLLFPFGRTYAIDRVVQTSVPTEREDLNRLNVKNNNSLHIGEVLFYKAGIANHLK